MYADWHDELNGNVILPGLDSPKPPKYFEFKKTSLWFSKPSNAVILIFKNFYKSRLCKSMDVTKFFDLKDDLFYTVFVVSTLDLKNSSTQIYQLNNNIFLYCNCCLGMKARN